MSRHGHEVRLIAPHYVKAEKNDAADAEAIVEAALRPTMRFVEPKSTEQQARAVACRTREQLVKQRTESVNALRSHLYERLQTMPGVGPITARAVETFAPQMEQFRRGRDFAAWLGLVPRQNYSGGKQILGKTSKMGQRDIRRLLVIGATAVIRWASRRGTPTGSWLARMLERKPIPVVAGEQDGAGHLGDAFAERELSGPGADRRLIRR